MRCRAACVMSSTARSNAASFTCEGLLKPESLRTNCTAVARTSSSVAGGSKCCDTWYGLGGFAFDAPGIHREFRGTYEPKFATHDGRFSRLRASSAVRTNAEWPRALPRACRLAISGTLTAWFVMMILPQPGAFRCGRTSVPKTHAVFESRSKPVSSRVVRAGNDGCDR